MTSDLLTGILSCTGIRESVWFTQFAFLTVVLGTVNLLIQRSVNFIVSLSLRVCVCVCVCGVYGVTGMI